MVEVGGIPVQRGVGPREDHQGDGGSIHIDRRKHGGNKGDTEF